MADTADRRTIYLSAPGLWQGAKLAALPYENHEPAQTLFGADGQMAAFAAMLRRDQIPGVVVPFPEMFSSGRSHALGLCCPDKVQNHTHVRFGPAVEARLLKGCRNLLVSAETGPQDRMPGPHPLIDGHVPAAFQHVFCYETDQPAPSSRQGSIPHSVLPPGFAHADLAASDRCGLMRMFATLDRFGPAATMIAAETTSYDSGTKFRHGLRSDQRGGDRLSTIMLPWNVNASGSLVPDLLSTLCRFFRTGIAGLTICLCPYNEYRTIEAIFEHQSFPVIVARIRHATAVDVHQAFDLAWIDRNDPDWRWTMRRLSRMGIRSILMGSAPDDSPVANVPAIERDGVRHAVHHDAQGDYVTRTGTLSARAITRLICMTRDLLARPHAPIPPDAGDENSSASVQNVLAALTTT